MATPPPHRDTAAAYLAAAWAAIEHAAPALEHPDPLVASTARREITRRDPLVFALVYLRHHLRSESIAAGRVTFSAFHHAAATYLRTWADPVDLEPRAHRTAWVAPREAAKSTWLFLIGPLWAGAHGHTRLVAAFSDTDQMARLHLSSIRHELEHNPLLRTDFPKFCAPARRPSGTTVADRQYLVTRESGWSMIARGLDVGVLGLKVGQHRPDVIIVDDPEPPEATYSAYQKRQRLTQLVDSVFALNLWARVIISGTVVMPGSIIDDLRRVAGGDVDPPDEVDGNRWVIDERVAVHHFLPIYDDDAGRWSIWPEKWPLEQLDAMAHTRSYAKNFLNAPLGAAGSWWTPGLIRVDPGPPTWVDDNGDTRQGWGRTLVWVDPATTHARPGRRDPDYTGIAVLSRAPAGTGAPARVWVRWAGQTRRVGGALTPLLVDLAAEYDPAAVMIEANQGGDVWADVLADIGLPLQTYTEHAPKQVRIERLHRRYEVGQVVHCDRWPDVEAQFGGWPDRVAHDDIIDAVASGVDRMLTKRRRRTTRSRSVSWVQ